MLQPEVGRAVNNAAAVYSTNNNHTTAQSKVLDAYVPIRRTPTPRKRADNKTLGTNARFSNSASSRPDEMYVLRNQCFVTYIFVHTPLQQSESYVPRRTLITSSLQFFYTRPARGCTILFSGPFEVVRDISPINRLYLHTVHMEGSSRAFTPVLYAIRRTVT